MLFHIFICMHFSYLPDYFGIYPRLVLLDRDKHSDLKCYDICDFFFCFIRCLSVCLLFFVQITDDLLPPTRAASDKWICNTNSTWSATKAATVKIWLCSFGGNAVVWDSCSEVLLFSHIVIRLFPGLAFSDCRRRWQVHCMFNPLTKIHPFLFFCSNPAILWNEVFLVIFSQE